MSLMFNLVNSVDQKKIQVADLKKILEYKKGVNQPGHNKKVLGYVYRRNNLAIDPKHFAQVLK